MKPLFLMLVSVLPQAMSAQFVGIGTATPTHRLHVSDSLSPMVLHISGTAAESSMLIGDSTNQLKLGAVDGNGIIKNQGGGDLQFVTGPTAGTMYLSYPHGHLGIGGYPASNKLTVVDVVNPGLGMFKCYGDMARIRVENGTKGAELGANPAYSYTGASGLSDFAIRNNGAERIYFDEPVGYIGVGTSTPTERIHVFSPLANSNVARFQSNGGFGQVLVDNGTIFSDLGADLTKGYVGTNSDHDFAIRSGGDTRIYLSQATGYVGINTNVPVKPLTIRANASTDIMQFSNHADVPVWHWWLPGDNLILTETGVADFRMTIQKQSGNVGIGLAFPEYRLDVAGSARVAGTFKAWGPNNLIVSNAPEQVAFYNNSFSNEGAPFENVTVYKDAEERIHMSGVVKIAGSQVGAMFQLPNGYRPAGDLVFAVMTSSGTMTRVNVTPNGFVTLQNATSGWVSVNGISFRAMQ